MGRAVLRRPLRRCAPPPRRAGEDKDGLGPSPPALRATSPRSGEDIRRTSTPPPALGATSLASGEDKDGLGPSPPALRATSLASWEDKDGPGPSPPALRATSPRSGEDKDSPALCATSPRSGEDIWLQRQAECCWRRSAIEPSNLASCLWTSITSSELTGSVGSMSVWCSVHSVPHSHRWNR
jgi:hypothetical protein